MSTIHTTNTNTYKIHVNEEQGGYYIVFNDTVTGRSIVLDQSSSKEYAISSAEKFPELYKIAQNEGYTLSRDEFINRTKRGISVNEAFDTDRSLRDFENLLRTLNQMTE